MRAMGIRWSTRARATLVDRAALHFRHRSSTDDANPSYALWAWQVTPRRDGGSTLTVSWTARPRSFWRRRLLARIREPFLAEEVRASLAAIDDHLRARRLQRHDTDRDVASAAADHAARGRT
jgi:hypothetical protein